MQIPDVNKIYQGDCLEIMRNWPDEFVDCIVTSPPYWGLRDYGTDEQIGLEDNITLWVNKITDVFREVKRIMKTAGTLWLNLGDCYLEKSLAGQPWRAAFSLQNDGWYLRSDIIWHKPNPMPESVTDRPTKSHEYIFLMTKNQKYYYDADAIAEKISEESMKRYSRVEKFGEEFDRLRHKHHSKVANRTPNPQAPMEVLTRAAQNVVDKGTRNKRDVWSVPVQGYKFAHFATFPEKLIEPCILAGCPEGGIVLDPFFGSGTTGVVAKRMSCNFIGCELNSEYIAIANKRLQNESRLF